MFSWENFGWDNQVGVAGFVFAEHTDVILRHLSEDWLFAAWQKVQAFCASQRLDTKSLGWGWLHSGCAALQYRQDSEFDWFGWTSEALYGWSDRKLEKLQELALPLAETSPKLRVGWSYRGKSYVEPPSESSAGIALANWLIVSVPEMWLHPSIHAEESSDVPTPHVGRLLSRAIESNDAGTIDAALSLARTTYSPSGFAIALRATREYLGERAAILLNPRWW